MRVERAGALVEASASFAQATVNPAQLLAVSADDGAVVVLQGALVQVLDHAEPRAFCTASDRVAFFLGQPYVEVRVHAVRHSSEYSLLLEPDLRWRWPLQFKRRPERGERVKLVALGIKGGQEALNKLTNEIKTVLNVKTKNFLRFSCYVQIALLLCRHNIMNTKNFSSECVEL